MGRSRPGPSGDKLARNLLYSSRWRGGPAALSAVAGMSVAV